jgi:glycosyltransferase involved in cell wall biosynthesis
MADNLIYSIIIPSYNRSDEINELLTSLAKIEFEADQFEVIIADDGSTDRTNDLVQNFQKSVPFALHYFSQKNQGPGAARNLGMSKAKGDFFIFLDSDVTVPHYWLKKIDLALKEEKADAFGGPDSYRDDFPALLKAINYSMTSFITTGGLRGKKGKKLAKYYPRSFNMGLSRDLWKKIGGFGSLRHGQDIEYSNRIIRSGAKVAFIADAEVFHKRRTNLKRFYKQVFNWGVARINLYKIDESMLELLHAAPAFATIFVALVVILAIFFYPFRILFMIGVILGIIILIYSMIDSVKMYKTIIPAFYLPLVMPAQVFGYGSGFIFNFVRRIILKRGEKIGFQKNYYK